MWQAALRLRGALSEGFPRGDQHALAISDRLTFFEMMLGLLVTFCPCADGRPWLATMGEMPIKVQPAAGRSTVLSFCSRPLRHPQPPAPGFSPGCRGS
jgi:hypothetical protein